MSNETSGQSVVGRLQEYLRQDPENWTLRADLFDAALSAGDVAAAREQVEAARLARPEDAAWRHREATLLLAGKRYAEAQALLEELVASGADHPAVRHNLAWALFAQGHLEEASTAVAPLLAAEGEVGAMAWALWLRCQHRLDRAAEALDAFAKASAGRPMSPDVWGVASLAAFEVGRFADAAAWSERALRARPDQLEALATRGSLALAKQDAAGALRWFEAALRVNGADGRSWSGVAFARMLKMDLPGAIHAFERSVASMPDHVGTWIGYGWSLFLSKQPQAARDAFERAVALDRNVGESHGALAVALVRLGDVEQAKKEIDVALRLEPTGMSARYAQAMIAGVTDDPEAFLRLSRRVFARIPAGGADSDRTLADVVFGSKG